MVPYAVTTTTMTSGYSSLTFRQQVDARHSWHFEIRENEVLGMLGEDLQSLRSLARGQGLVARLLQLATE